MELRGKVALVTGGGRRVGRALALALGGRGASVAVHYNESDKGAREVAERIAKEKGRAETFAADLMQDGAPADLIKRVVGTFGQLDVLVNSAAIMMRTPFGEIAATEWEKIFALNLRAPFFLAQAAAPHLRRAKGAIVNIADLAAFETWPALTQSRAETHPPRALSCTGGPQARGAGRRSWALNPGPHRPHRPPGSQPS